jgi:hypothetical protein
MGPERYDESFLAMALMDKLCLSECIVGLLPSLVLAVTAPKSLIPWKATQRLNDGSLVPSSCTQVHRSKDFGKLLAINKLSTDLVAIADSHH